jgi:hypothetical protein
LFQSIKKRKDQIKMWRNMFFRKKVTKPDITIIRNVNALIERVAACIFKSHAQDLVNEDVSYIIYATWGAKERGQLTETQKIIHNKIDPEVRAIYDSLRLESIADPQSMAIYSLIRGFVIFKILFMVEHLRNQLGNYRSSEKDAVQEVLHHIRTIGNE